GDDNINAGAGIDTLDYSDQTSGVTVALEFNSAFGGAIGSDTIFGFENVRGGSGNDTLAGDGGNNTFYSSLGDDNIQGGAGIDTYDASGSTHGITAIMSINSVGGTGVGNDSITGIENIVGSNFSDNLNGDGNANRLEGGLGNDFISGGGGNDVI